MSTTTHREAPGSGSVLTLSTIGFTLMFAVWLMFGILGVPIQKEFGLTNPQLFWISSLAVLNGSMWRLPAGMLADRIGGKKVMLFLLLAGAVSSIAVSFAQNYAMLLVLAFLVGFVGNSFSVGVAWNSAWFTQHRKGFALGVFGAGNVGASVTKFIGPAIIAATAGSTYVLGIKGGWRLIPVIYAVLLLLTALAMLFLTPRVDRVPGSAMSAGIRVPRHEASAFGIIDADDSAKINQFLEKPADPPGLPDSPDESFASMGNYIFTRKAFIEALEADAADPESKRDMGGNIVPWFVRKGQAQVYDFTLNEVPGATEKDKNYWRDVGTIDAYHEAHMDLVSVDPEFNLYNPEWPIWTQQVQAPGAKFTLRGTAEDSIVSAGSIISGADVDHSVLSPNVRCRKYSKIDGSILMNNVNVGRGARIMNAILDKGVTVAEGAEIGVNKDHDRARGFHVSAGGITVVSKGMHVAAE